ncbi:acyltransferase family protein [Frigidibacter sp. MR17.14]|uniref:acyltransferase family protein n=1 Tax=Frigidibacter sp. MR17.14 TaxID=3126509 RepID=UPI003012FDBE
MAGGQHRRDIQGLRAIAVLGVVVFHAFPRALPGGFAGVDVFFAISGFLIGGILRRDIAAGRFGLAEFYRRRMRRIAPALLAMLALTVAGGLLVLSPEALRELARTAFSSIFFVSNVDFYRHSGYFDRAAELRPLLHTWSLSVEEQFYLVFPLALALLMRRGAGALVPVTAVAALGLLGLSHWGIGQDPLGAYFLLPYRGFEFLLGALAAYLPPPRPRAGRAASALGLALIVASLWLITPEHPFPGLWALLPAGGTALVLHGGRSGATGLPDRLLGHPLALFFGAISYSLYLWHWPVMAYLRILTPGEPPVPVMALALALSVLLGWASWRLVERPAMALPPTAPILRGGLAAMVVLGAGTVVLHQSGGWPGRFPDAARAYFAGAQDFSPDRGRCHQDDDSRLPYAQACVLGPAQQEPAGTVDLVVWGDSHGTELAAALAQGHRLRQVTASACPPVTGLDFPRRPHCRSANAALLADLVADGAVRSVVLAVNHDAYPELPGPGLAEGLGRVVSALRGAGKQVILLGQIPVPGFEVPQVAGARRAIGIDPAGLAFAPERSADWDAALADLARDPGVRLVDPRPLLCPAGRCPVTADGRVLYFNATHPSMAGAALLARAIEPLL